MIQPPLAFIWSFLILGERLNIRQMVGIATVLSGLLAFLLVNQRANHAIGSSAPGRPPNAPPRR